MRPLGIDLTRANHLPITGHSHLVPVDEYSNDVATLLFGRIVNEDDASRMIDRDQFLSRQRFPTIECLAQCQCWCRSPQKEMAGRSLHHGLGCRDRREQPRTISDHKRISNDRMAVLLSVVVHHEISRSTSDTVMMLEKARVPSCSGQQRVGNKRQRHVLFQRLDSRQRVENLSGSRNTDDPSFYGDSDHHRR